MASVAASGGYFLSAHADKIVANKHTVTGSIGVLFVKPSFEGLYEKLGVRQDDFDRGAYMRGLSPARRWRPQDQAAADSAIKRTYRTFVERVMDGRRLQTFEAYGYAQGRPWMGEDAAERKLVDAIGGLESAIDEARRLGGIPKGEKIAFVEFKHPQGGLLDRVIGSWLRERVGEQLRLSSLDGMQARTDDWVRELD
jgi:protease-4